MECNMSMSYNLRSLKRRKVISARNSYLQNISENSSPEGFNPKVCLERLKLLECHDIQNSRFYLKKGRITVMKNKSESSKKYLLKLFCTIILIVTTLAYWRGNKIYGIELVKKYAEIYPAFENIYSEAVKFYKQIMYSQQNSDGKSIFELPKPNTTVINDNFEIRQLVRDYLIEIKKKNKIKKTEDSPQSFIEEQCKINVEDNHYLKKKKFFNVTYYDLTNLTDYALESQGAKIETVFNTEMYDITAVNISVKYLNINLWPELSHFLMKHLKYFSLNGPNSILIPWRKPGDCWAFKGSHGRVQIQLSSKIIITGVTVEHIPKELTAKENIQSAPKKFSVLGVQDSGNNKKTYLGSYQYDISGPAAQTFLIQPRVEIPFKSVEIDIDSNHGNEKYTCIYKIRIHGHR